MTVEGQTDEDLLHILAHDTGGWVPVASPATLRLAKHVGGGPSLLTVPSLECLASLHASHSPPLGHDLPAPPRPALPCPALPADSFNRWEAGHVLAKKLMRALYASAAASNAGTPAERCVAAGGVKLSLVDAYRSLLNGAGFAGVFAFPHLCMLALFVLRPACHRLLYCALRLTASHPSLPAHSPSHHPGQHPACRHPGGRRLQGLCRQPAGEQRAGGPDPGG